MLVKETVASSNESVGVEHNSEGSAHSSWGKILLEMSSNSASVSVRSNDGSPHNSVSCVVFQALCLEDVSNSLAIVKACVFPVLETLNSKESLLLILSGLASSETSEDSSLIQSTGTGYEIMKEWVT
jgi:hypothetical protein